MNYIDVIKLLDDCFEIKEDGKSNHSVTVHRVAECTVTDDIELAIASYDSNLVAQLWSGKMKLSIEDAKKMDRHWNPARLKKLLMDSLPDEGMNKLFDSISVYKFNGRFNKSEMIEFCVNLLRKAVGERIPVAANTSTNAITQRLDKILSELKELPAPEQLMVPEEETEEEMEYIGELYRAYSEEEGCEITKDNIYEFEEWIDDLTDRRIQYFAAESVRRGLEDIYLDGIENQFNVLKAETLSGVNDTWRRPYSTGYQRMLAVMEASVQANITNYILSNAPNWISNDIRKGVCHFLVKDGKLYWVKKRRSA